MEVVIKIGELGVLDAVSDEWIEWYGLEHQEKFTLLEKIEFPNSKKEFRLIDLL